MPYIQNPLGSGGFGIQPLGDMTSNIQSLQRTEIASKLAEIRQNKAWERDDKMRNEAFALEMASPKIINDMRAGVATKALKDAETLLNLNTEMVKKANAEGRALTLPEKMELMTKFKTVENNSMQAKNFVDAFEEGQKIHITNLSKITDPIEREQYSKQWAELYTDIQNKDLSELPPSRIMRAVEPPPPPVYKTFDLVDKEIGLGLKDVKSRDEIRNIVAAKIAPRAQSLLPLGQTSGSFEDENQMVDFFTERAIGYKKEPIVRAAKASGSGGGADKNARDYTPAPFAYKNTNYNMVQIPSDVSQVDRNFFISKARNLDTGEEVQLDQNKASLLGVDVDKGVVILKGIGGYATKDGEPLLVQEGMKPSKDRSGAWSGRTESEITNPSNQESILKAAYKGKRPIDEIKGIAIDKTEDGLVLRGTIVEDKPLWGTGTNEVPVEVKFNQFKDPKAEAVFEAPLSENKPAVAIMFPKVKVRGIPLEQYVDRPQTQKADVTQDEYAKLKKGDTYYYQGKEYKKQ